jgi:hypothetical protein
MADLSYNHGTLYLIPNKTPVMAKRNGKAGKTIQHDTKRDQREKQAICAQVPGFIGVKNCKIVCFTSCKGYLCRNKKSPPLLGDFFFKSTLEQT